MGAKIFINREQNLCNCNIAIFIFSEEEYRHPNSLDCTSEQCSHFNNEIYIEYAQGHRQKRLFSVSLTRLSKS
jgi:hypothetical protein